MCFSATASFTASAVLGAAGVYSLARPQQSGRRLLSAIPLLFAVQQAVEGVLWIALRDEAWQSWERPTTFIFLFFAQMLWPIYIPLSVRAAEADPKRKRLMTALLVAGLALAGYTGWCLATSPVQAVIRQHHIQYELGFALTKKWYYGLLYFVPTILAPIFATDRRVHWLAYLFFASYVLARLAFHFYEISVWCFFGAVISLAVLYMTAKRQPAV